MTLTVAKRPCGSCPYRRDVPSGVWSAHEYDKLPPYDEPTWAQPMAVFLCHQRDGSACAGWLACHGGELLSMRMEVGLCGADPALLDYQTDVPVFGSGTEAAVHGLRDLHQPGDRANRLMDKLTQLPGIKS